MGGGQGSTGHQSSAGTTTFVESALSKEQAKILKKHEEQYQQYFFPELKNQLEESKKGGEGNILFAKTAAGINDNAQTQQMKLADAMARRGIQDSGSALAGNMSIEQAKGAALANAYFNSQLQNKQKTMSILQMGMGMSPRPTTAAPVGQEGERAGNTHNASWGFHFMK